MTPSVDWSVKVLDRTGPAYRCVNDKEQNRITDRGLVPAGVYFSALVECHRPEELEGLMKCKLYSNCDQVVI